jgi:hypothetical protein
MPPATRFILAFILTAAPLGAQARELAPALKAYVTVNEPVVALTNARVVDGTGTPVKDGQTIVIRGEKIAAVGPASSVTVPAGARTIDLAGKTVIPGIIGLHDHMYYGGMKFMGVSYPRLFLSAGVTTIRTTGSVDAYQELNLKRLSDSLRIVAPTIVVTGPYLQGAGSGFVGGRSIDSATKRAASYATGPRRGSPGSRHTRPSPATSWARRSTMPTSTASRSPRTSVPSASARQWR